MCVIFTHLHSYDFMTRYGLEKYNILVSGTAGVNLFYVLSGFLITTLAIREFRKTETFSIKKFFIRRALRIFPLYYLALYAYLLLQLFRVQKTTMDSFVYAFFYLYNFASKKVYDSWLGSFHTLATEEHFYLVFPFIFFICFRINKYIFLLVILAYIYFIPGTRVHFANFEATHNVSLWTIYACMPILVGCIFAFLREQSWLYAAFQNLTDHAAGRLFAQALFIVFWLYFFLQQINGYNPVFFAIGFGFLILFCVEFTENWAVRLLSMAPLVYLGKISYGLYVWQSVIIGTGDSSRIVSPKALAFALIFILSILSYELFEKRILRLKDRWR